MARPRIVPSAGCPGDDDLLRHHRSCVGSWETVADQVMGRALVDDDAARLLVEAPATDLPTGRWRVVHTAARRILERGEVVDLSSVRAEVPGVDIAWLSSLDLSIASGAVAAGYISAMRRHAAEVRRVDAALAVVRGDFDGADRMLEALGAPSHGARARVVSLEELAALALPPRAPILDGLLYAGDTAMIYAARGAGKTWVSLAIALAAATAGTFARWHASRPTGVLLVDGEMHAEDLRERLELLRGGFPEVAAPFNVLAATLQERPLPSVATPEGQALVEAHLDGIGLLVIDNVATLCRPPSGRSENETESWADVQAWLIRLRSRGLAVIVVHHTGKSGDQRGASAREDILNTSIKLERPTDADPSAGAVVDWHVSKGRGIVGDSALPMRLELVEAGAGLVWEWSPLSAERKRGRAGGLAAEVRGLLEQFPLLSGETASDTAARVHERMIRNHGKPTKVEDQEQWHKDAAAILKAVQRARL